MSTKTSGGAAKQPKSDIAKKEFPDDQIADMKILRTLAKYLWLKDNVEFRFRVVLALGLLVGAKVSVLPQLSENFKKNFLERKHKVLIIGRYQYISQI